MYGRLRRKSRPQAQTEPKFIQSRFDGGLNEERPATNIGENEMPVLENLISFTDGIEGRSGTQLFSDTALPGSGTVHVFVFHKGASKFLLHRGTSLYYADNTMSSWTELLFYPDGFFKVTPNGDTGSQISYLSIGGPRTTNTDSGTLYWNLTNSGTTRTLNIYSNSAKTTLVATGSRSGDGSFNLTPSNSSKLYGYCRVVYSSDDTDSGNTITGLLTGSSTEIGGTATFYDASLYSIKPYGGDAVVFQTAIPGTTSITTSIIYVDLTLNRIYPMNRMNDDLNGAAATPKDLMLPILDSGTEGSSTPYGRRYLYTFSRIVDRWTETPDLTLDRTTGKLKFEMPSTPVSNHAFSGYTPTRRDFGEHWFANAVSTSNTHSVSLLAQTGQSVWNTADPLDTLGANNLSPSASFTHISIYGTLDIGDNGIDPATGSGNNREIYVWLGDIPRNSLTFTDSFSDEVLRSRYVNGFGLRTRFWTGLTTAEIGAFSGSFLCTAKLGGNEIKYCQLDKPEYIGFHNSDLQVLRVDDAIQEMHEHSNGIIVLCRGKTYFINTQVYSDSGTLESVFVLRGPQKVSDSIGVVDTYSIAPVDKNTFIAKCSDNAIRVFSGMQWGQDLGADKITTRLATILATGSIGAYHDGVYLLWYRIVSGSVTNARCIRYGFGGKAGIGWSICSGADFPFPSTQAGAAILNDSNNRSRLIVFDNADGQFHWVETYTNQALTKVYKDKVATDGSGGTNIYPVFRTRELTGETEDHTCYHEESHVYLRPAGSAYLSGFSLTATAYVDGGFTAVATIDASTEGGDIQYFDRVRGKRIQQQYAFIGSGFKVVKIDTHFQVHDTSAIGDGPADTSEADYQEELASSIKHWLTRPLNLKNRANASNYTLSAAAPTNLASPDGNQYGLSFGSDDGSDGSYLQLEPTSYTGSFSVLCFIRNPTTGGNIITLKGANNFYIKFNSLSEIDVNGDGNVTIDLMSADLWYHFAFIRTSSTVRVYQNGVLKGSVTVSGTKGGASIAIDDPQNGVSIFDLRIYNTAISTNALDFYYDDVINNTGTKVMPIV